MPRLRLISLDNVQQLMTMTVFSCYPQSTISRSIKPMLFPEAPNVKVNHVWECEKQRWCFVWEVFLPPPSDLTHARFNFCLLQQSHTDSLLLITRPWLRFLTARLVLLLRREKGFAMRTRLSDPSHSCCRCQSSWGCSSSACTFPHS